MSWLVQYGPNKHRGVKTLPIKELAALASSVTNYISELPEIVHFHFRETIAARKRLSQFFRKTVDASNNDADTVNHEHFTTRYELASQTVSELTVIVWLKSIPTCVSSATKSAATTMGNPVREAFWRRRPSPPVTITPVFRSKTYPMDI